MLVFMGLLGRSLITPEIKIIFKAKYSLKRFLGQVSPRCRPFPGRALGTRIRSVKFPSFRHFQDRFLTTIKEKWGKQSLKKLFRKVLGLGVLQSRRSGENSKMCFARFWFWAFRGPFASHDWALLRNPQPVQVI